MAAGRRIGCHMRMCLCWVYPGWVHLACICLAWVHLGTLAALPAAAEEAGLSETGPVQLDGIVAIATGDWNGDRFVDAALILMPQHEADDMTLTILRGSIPTGRLKPIRVLPNFVWGSPSIAGQVPRLRNLRGGGFMIETMNEAIGRHRWRQRLFVSFAGEAPVVSRFAYWYYDTLGMAQEVSCTLDFLNGAGEIDGEEVDLEQAPLDVAEWDDETGLRLCGIV